MRSTQKDAKYFAEQEKYNEEMISTFRAIIDEPDTEAAHRQSLLHAVYRRELEQLVTRYSLGGSVPELREHYPRVIDALEAQQQEAGTTAQDFENFDAYVFALWIVSLGILLDVDIQLLRRAVRELGNLGRDALYDNLLALKLPGLPRSADILYREPYAPLADAFCASGAEQTRLMEQFVSEWYEGMRCAYWHNSHLGEDAGFFGYWCFELAAIVKMLRIDDAEWKSNVFYPGDLV